MLQKTDWFMRYLEFGNGGGDLMGGGGEGGSRGVGSTLQGGRAECGGKGCRYST